MNGHFYVTRDSIAADDLITATYFLGSGFVYSRLYFIENYIKRMLMILTPDFGKKNFMHRNALKTTVQIYSNHYAHQ